MPSPNDLTKLSAPVRRSYFQKAKIRESKDIRSADIWRGPESSIAVLPDSEVPCHYVEEKIAVGFTPKFKCRSIDSGEVFRVKYSRRETFAEVAGTRLLWALGFFTDKNYPVRLRCYDCPEKKPADPETNEKRTERILSDAMMEKNFEGEELGQFPDQGWKWSELKNSGAGQAEIDALKLIAVFLQHTDSKPPQQRLGCYEKNLQWQNSKLVCTRPVLMIQDLGATFGAGTTEVGGFSAMYYKGWERMKIWDTELEEQILNETGNRTCIGRLTSAFKDGLFNPEISEEGRALLADLLNQLSDDQIHDLFRVSRVEQLKETMLENGKEVPVTIEHWVSAFKKKRDEINHHRCK